MEDWLKRRKELKNIKFDDNNVKFNQLHINQKDFIKLKLISKGQFGSIELVKCKLNGSFYALKVMNKGFSKRNIGVSFFIYRSRHLTVHSSAIRRMRKLYIY